MEGQPYGTTFHGPGEKTTIMLYNLIHHLQQSQTPPTPQTQEVEAGEQRFKASLGSAKFCLKRGGGGWGCRE